MAHYKKHPPYKNPFKPTKDEINKVYENNPKGKASFLKMLSQSSIPNQNPFDQQLPIKWNNPNNMERAINPVLQIDRKMVAKKRPVTDADGHIMGYNIQYRKNAGSKQTQLVIGSNPGKLMKNIKRGQGLGTSSDPIVFT
jgi:hypothetical protein